MINLSSKYTFPGAVLEFFLLYVRFGDAGFALGKVNLFDIERGVDGTLELLGYRYEGFTEVYESVVACRAALGGREVGTYKEERSLIVGKLGDISDRALKAGDFGSALRGVELEAKVVDVLIDKKHVQVDTNIRNMGLGSLMQLAEVDEEELGIIDGGNYKVLPATKDGN